MTLIAHALINVALIRLYAQIDIRDAKCLTAARWVVAQLRRADLSAWASADPILGVRRVLPSPLNIIADHTRSLS
jgi:hypothetical protein